MDFPIFHFDGMGDRMLVGCVAVLHVLINHSMAVGAIPVITIMEWWGHRTRDPRWDEFAYKFLFFCFIVTTTLGAITGVGIWFTTSLVNPAAIGSLLRVFFWGWFTEWIVFVTEVCLIMAYFLLWKKWQGNKKWRHIALGAGLSLFSWITMALIVAILGFMMSTGDWAHQPTLIHGFFNPLYLPQLAFRTPLALMTGGLMGMLLALFFTKKGEFRNQLIFFLSGWVMVWLPLTYISAKIYWQAIPSAMIGNLQTAVTTLEFTGWYSVLMRLAALSVVVIAAVGLWGILAPQRLPRVALILPICLALALLGYFERVREFIRKPYIIANYMYANGLRVEDYPLLQRDGILAHCTYVSVHEVTPENELEAGKEVFLVACSRCHTVSGENGVVAKFQNMYGTNAWNQDGLVSYIKNMHGARTFMPAFPGNDAELNALAIFLTHEQRQQEPVAGVQTVGLPVSLEASISSMTPKTQPAANSVSTSKSTDSTFE